MRAKAAILVRLRKPLVVDEVDVPEPGRGQVLVKVLYSGLCGSQLGEIDGIKGADKHLPHLLGHEGSGLVVRTGPGVTRVRPGDAVVMHWRKGFGAEGAPPVFGWRGRRLNAGWVTTFNEYAVAAENRLTRVPKGLDPRLTPLLGCAVTTGMGIVRNDAGLRKGESLVVFGAGGIGLSVIQAARLAGASPIVAVDVFDNKLRLAKRLGADVLVNARATAAEPAVRAAVGAAGADVVVENTGAKSVIELCWELTQPRGRTILAGVPHHKARPALDTMPLHFGKILTGSHGGSAHPGRDIPACLALIKAGRLALAPMVTGVYPLARVNEAIADLRGGRVAGRALIKVAAR